jgi:hypothetical protein
MRALILGVGISAVAGLATAGLAQSGAAPTLGVDLGAGVQAEARQPEATPAPPAPGAAPATDQPDAGVPAAGPTFGHVGAQFFSVAAGYSNNFQDDQAGSLTLGYSRFIADELEFNLELTGWYFVQDGDDTGGLSPIMNLRWHLLHAEDYSWSVFGEAGFGLLFAFDNVPDGGTGFNFLPRLGAGFTTRLDDEGTRLIMGVRWQHISNGRIEGDERNPARDSLMVWAGVMVPF